MHERVRDAFGGKPVFIGEVGWPSAGRRREDAVASRVDQARFVREFMSAAAERRLRYNVIEAFDQPWKRRLEGTVGGAWGLQDAAGAEKFPLYGAVSEDPHWLRGWQAMGIGAIAFLVLGLVRAPRLRASGVLFMPLAGAATGAAWAAHRTMLQAGVRDTFEAVVGYGFAGVATLAGALTSLALARWLDGHRVPVPAPLVAVWRWFLTNRSEFGHLERWLGTLRFLVLFGAALTCLLLAFDPRYRDFPVAGFAPPLAGFALLAWAASPGDRARSATTEERLLAGLIAASLPVIVWHETFANTDALKWVALCAAGALAVGVPRRPRRDEQADDERKDPGLLPVEHEARTSEAGGRDGHP
jgi:glucan 1,3-beta-glucosidase